MKLYKTLLLVLVSLSVVLAASPERQEKLKEVREARQAASSGSESIMAASSDFTPVNLGLSGLTILAVDAKPSGVVWVSGWVGAADYAFYSGDNGASWTKYQFPATTNGGYTNLSAANDSVAIIANYDGVIFRTENRGAKWDTVYRYSNTDSAWFDGVKFIDGTTGYAVGDADFFGLHLVKTTDAGKTWNRITTIPTEVKQPGAVFAAAGYGKLIDGNGSNVWAAFYFASAVRATQVGVPIIRSTDGGATWTYHLNVLAGGGANNYYFRSITFKDATTGWGIGRRASSSSTLDNPLFKTTDGGVTWSDSIPIQPGVPLTVNKVRTVNLIGGSTNLLAVGISGSGAAAWLSTDGGTTFTQKLSPTGTSEWRGAGGYDLTHMYVGGTGGSGLYKYQQAVKVTIMANTAGVPDTLKYNSFVQIRGGAAQITWGADSPAKMTNLGTANAPSDYWTYTGYFPVGASFNYKLFTNAKSALAANGSDDNNGWEGNVSVSNNDRPILVGNNDTTIQLQYVNGFAEKPGQFAAPFNNADDDTVVVYLKVNMQGAIASTLFDPLKHKVGVRGSFASSQWGTTVIMSPMADHNNGGSRQYNAANLYTVAIKWVKSQLDSPSAEKTMRWKYVIHNIASPNTEDWSLMRDNPDGNVGEFTMPKKDTTIYWTWYRGQPYVQPPGADTVTVKFRTDLSTALVQKGWKPGDSVVVKYGYGGTAAQVFTAGLTKVGLSGNIYESASLLTPGVAVGKPVQYQYYLNTGDVREIFYDFGYAGADAGAAERRKFDVASNKQVLTVLDTSKSITVMRRQPTWQNTNKLGRDVLVTYTCDLRPAYYHLAGGDSLFDVQSAFRTILPTDKDSVYPWGVWMNGPAVGGWSNANGDWGNGLRANLTKKMFDDGTHGDAVAGDRIYTLQVQYKKDSTTVGQVFKFGLNAGDNEGGKGGFGNNHVENIDDAGATATIAAQFGSINPTYFKAWNYDQKKPTGVKRDGDAIPVVFSLEQNYPNPFNPSTSIKYSIPMNSLVTLKVYNILGQEVATLVNETLEAGNYSASFNATKLASGVYLYRIEAGAFTSVKKMMLLK